MLTSETFYHRFEKNFFYRDFQLLFREIEKEMHSEFINWVDFENIKTLQDCLLNFDDSCEEIYQWKDFVKIAVSGRHKGIHCI